MSTTFGIPIKQRNIEINEYDEMVRHVIGIIDDEEYYDESFTEVWFRSLGNCRWLNPLGELLPDNTKVYALDNTQQGVYTIGDIKKIMDKQDKID
jgi:hypothetical protein